MDVKILNYHVLIKNIETLYKNIFNKIIIHYDNFIDMYLMFGHDNMLNYEHIKMKQYEYLLFL